MFGKVTVFGSHRPKFAATGYLLTRFRHRFYFYIGQRIYHEATTVSNCENMKTAYNDCGSGCRPVAALVFKISGRLRAAGVGGFDSHPLPLHLF